MSAPDMCRYSPGRELDYYASGLAGILRVVGAQRGGSSTHAYTKEVRRALETLVYIIWDRHEECIDSVVGANIPPELRSTSARTCFAELLKGLLKKFRETAEKLPVGARIKLMNMVIAAIAEMARYNLPPAGARIKELVFSKTPSPAPSPEHEGGENP